MLIPKSERIARVVITIFLILLAIICVLPMIYELAVSFSTESFVTTGQVTFWPVGFTTASYAYLMNYSSFWKSMLTSFERVILQWLLCMVLTVLAWIFFIPMIFNGGLIPSYMVVSTLGLLGSIWALVLPSVVVTFYVLLLMNFIRSLPAEMEEAAMIDGASPMQILIRIILPVMVPCLATITVYTTLATWNEWFQGVIYMNDPSQYPLMSYLRSTVLISNMENLTPQEQERLANIGNKTYQAAQLFIASVPMLLVYPFLQKYFTKGLVLGSVKG